MKDGSEKKIVVAFSKELEKLLQVKAQKSAVMALKNWSISVSSRN